MALGVVILLLFFLLNSPWVQRRTAAVISGALEEQIGSHVALGGLHWRLPGDIVLDSIRVDDREGAALLTAERLAVKIDWRPLIKRRQVVVRNIRLFRPYIAVHADSVGGELNCQFLVDAFVRTDTTASKPTMPDLRIHSLIVRGARLRYDVLSEPQTDGQFNPSHVDVTDFNAHLSVKALSADTLSVILRQLSLREQSGFALDNLMLRLVANREGATVAGLSARMPQSELRVDSLFADYADGVKVRAVVPSSTLAASDLAAFVPALGGNASKLTLSTTLKADADGRFDVERLLLRMNKRDVDVLLQGSGDLRQFKKSSNLSPLTPNPYVDARIHRLTVTKAGWTSLENLLAAVDSQTGLSSASIARELAGRVGAASLTGSAAMQLGTDGKPALSAGDLALKADVGEADVRWGVKGTTVTAHIDTRSLNLGHALRQSDVGSLTASLALKGKTDGAWQKLLTAEADGQITSIDYKNYTYSPITAQGTWDGGTATAQLAVDDPNIRTRLTAAGGMTDGVNTLDLRADVSRLNLHALHLTEMHEGTRFSFHAGGHLTARTFDDLRGELSVDSLRLDDAEHTWMVRRFHAGSYPNGAQKRYTIDSDFMQMRASGYFTLENLGGSLYNLLAEYVPTLLSTMPPSWAKAGRKADKAAGEGAANLLTFETTFSDLSPLNELFGIPVRAAYPIKISGNLLEDREVLKLNADVPHLRYGENTLRGVTLSVTNENRSSLLVSFGGEKVEKEGAYLMADAQAVLQGDGIELDAEWGNSERGLFEGSLHAHAAFEKDDKGRLLTRLTGRPSSAVITGETWTLAPFTATVGSDAYAISGFRLTNGPQYLTVDGRVVAHKSSDNGRSSGVQEFRSSDNGAADESLHAEVSSELLATPELLNSSNDSISVRLNGIDIAPFVSMAKLEGISFGGVVSGAADVAGLLTKAPRVEADLTIAGLTFCEAPMGDASVVAGYDDRGIVFDLTSPSTNIAGIASIADNALDLTIRADSTDIRFLGTLLADVMNDVKGRGKGSLRIHGKFDALDLEGDLLAENASFTIVPTGVRYAFNDHIRFTPGAIRFDNILVKDAFYTPGQTHRSAYASGLEPHTAVLNGSVTHSHLQKWAYDLTINTNTIQGLNLPNTGADPVWTTIYADGRVQIQGSEAANQLNIDVNAQTRPGSFFALSLGGDAAAETDFITFRDRDQVAAGRERMEQLRAETATTMTTTTLRRRTDRPATTGRRTSVQQPDVNINVRADITPNAELRLVTDATTGDAVTAQGSGVLNIEMRNEDIGLYGTYTFSRGEYTLSLQDLVRKRFEIVDGSNIIFDGDPLDARLGITASHSINSVALSDLSADASSMGSVRVNCLLGIGGTPNVPQLTFGIELPQGTEEQKTLLRTYTATDEQTNLQFIYLLALSRFYTYDYSQASTQGTLGGMSAMQSLLNSTISSQLNSLISNLLPSENWSLSSSIKSDNLLGTSDEEIMAGNMEVQGVLEGRLLNNRLLINGNFGYRDNPMYASSFIGDFDIRYLLLPGSNLWLKGYNKTNDRYFSRTALTTQGIGLMFNRDFDGLFRPRVPATPPAAPADTLGTSLPSEELENSGNSDDSGNPDNSEMSENSLAPAR